MRRFSRTWILVSAFILAGGSAFGSGFSIFEQGAKATAMGGAFCATADDPSAIFYNVAGIAQQRHTAFYAGGTAINFANEFAGDPNDAFTSGQKGFYKRHTFVPPNAYAIVPIGYPDKPFGKVRRLPIQQVTHLDRWGTPYAPPG